jgi:hypothetical protein
VPHSSSARSLVESLYTVRRPNPSLEWPVAANPGPSLEAVAKARGWPILRLFGTPSS